MLTPEGKKIIWQNICGTPETLLIDKYETTNKLFLALGYYKDNQFCQISKETLEKEAGKNQSTVPNDTRNYEKLPIYFVSDGEYEKGYSSDKVNNVTNYKLYSNKIKDQTNEKYDSRVYLYYDGEDCDGHPDNYNEITVKNLRTFMFAEIDDGSPDNVNNENTTSYGGWGTITGIALVDSNNNTLFSAELDNPIVTKHAQQLRFPEDSLSFTISFTED